MPSAPLWLSEYNSILGLHNPYNTFRKFLFQMMQCG